MSQPAVNRRPTKVGNIDSDETLREICEIAHAHDVSVALTLNEPGFTASQRETARRQAARAVSVGVDAVIAADQVLVRSLASDGISVHLSSTANVTNAPAIEPYLAQGNVTKVILPRHVSLQEIGDIANAWPGLEFEAIAMGDPCHWDDGLCGFEHNLHEFGGDISGLAGGACSKRYQVLCEGLADPEERLAVEMAYDAMRRFMGCGLCGLWQLSRSISVIKATGRDNPLLRNLYIRYLVAAALASDELGEQEFQVFARDLRQRMAEEFVTGHAVGVARSGAPNAQVGAILRDVIAESSILDCEPPFTCYWPELYPLRAGWRSGLGNATPVSLGRPGGRTFV